MRKLIVLISVILVIGLVGCSNSITPSVNPSGNNGVVTTTTPAGNVGIYEINPALRPDVPPVDGFWISPAFIETPPLEAGNSVTKYKTGEPIGVQIHNGGQVTETKRVTNTYNDVEVIIQLKDYLYDIDQPTLTFWQLQGQTNIFSGHHYMVSVSSNMAGESLRVTDYNPSNKSITISGLIDPPVNDPDGLHDRIVSIVYVGTAPRTFHIEYVCPDTTRPGFNLPPAMAENWVQIESPYITLDTFETAVVPIALYIPSEAVINGKWSYWIKVSQEASGGGGVALSIEYKQLWLINMK